MDPLHLLPLSVMVIPIIWGIYGYYHSKKHRLTATDAEGVTTSNWPLIINSAVLYALAFNLIFFIQELFLALGKRWLGLKAYLYHNNHGWDGEHPQAALAQGYGAASIFICAVIFLLLARRVINKKHWMQVFFSLVSLPGICPIAPTIYNRYDGSRYGYGPGIHLPGHKQACGFIDFIGIYYSTIAYEYGLQSIFIGNGPFRGKYKNGWKKV